MKKVFVGIAMLSVLIGCKKEKEDYPTIIGDWDNYRSQIFIDGKEAQYLKAHSTYLKFDENKKYTLIAYFETNLSNYTVTSNLDFQYTYDSLITETYDRSKISFLDQNSFVLERTSKIKDANELGYNEFRLLEYFKRTDINLIKTFPKK